MKKYLILFTLLFLITSCSNVSNEEAVQTSVAQTLDEQKISQTTEEAIEKQTEEAKPTNTNTVIPTNTPRPTNTKGPTNTPKPTLTPTEEPTIDTSAIIAKNYLASEDQNGVMVEVSRIIIGQKEAVIKATGLDFNEFPILEDKRTIVEFIFKIVNNTDKVIRFYFEYDTVASVNGEQIVFDDYDWEDNTWFGDNLDGDILPGSTLIGGLWTGIKRSKWDEITTITISIPEAFESEDYSDVTGTYLFTIDVVDWTFEELPDELK